MKVVAFLPAKGTSERIESKNAKFICGKPLFVHTLEKLLKCSFIDEVYLDSESEEIFSLAEHLDGFHKLLRDENLASNKTDGHSLFYNEVSKVDADIYIQILGTSPFIEIETIKKGVEILKTDNAYDSAVLVRKEKMYLWKDNKPAYDFENIPNSFTLEDTVFETMGLYITNKKVALEDKKRIGQKPFLLEATPLEAVDINRPEDFELANTLLLGQLEKEANRFRSIGKLINSAILSDVMDDLGLDGFIRGLKPNVERKKILGRAKPIKIRPLRDGEDFMGIYDALLSYDIVVNNDIICVENEVKDYAYFGNLNSNLAIQAGAIGTIVSSVTRDKEDVSNLDYPVFSLGYSSKDVRKRATLDSINKPIKINGITIKPNDLVFADSEGIVVIPKSHEEIVLNNALKSLQTENKIVNDILNKVDVNTIMERHGTF